MNLMIQPNQICLIVKLYNNRPELLPDSNGKMFKKTNIFVGNKTTKNETKINYFNTPSV